MNKFKYLKTNVHTSYQNCEKNIPVFNLKFQELFLCGQFSAIQVFGMMLFIYGCQLGIIIKNITTIISHIPTKHTVKTEKEELA